MKRAILFLLVSFVLIEPLSAQQAFGAKSVQEKAKSLQRTLDKPSSANTLESVAKSIRAKRAADIFKWARQNLKFQPYQGQLRGAEGVAVDLTGNSVDQALFLHEIFKQKGIQSRFVRGQLSETQIDEVLYRFAGSASLINPSGLSSEKVVVDASVLARYRTLLDEHVWLEIEDNGAWLGVDPIFNQGLGPSAVDAKSRETTLWNDLQSSVSIEFRAALADGQIKTFGQYTGPLSHLGTRDISLTFEQDVRLNHAIRPIIHIGDDSKVGGYLPKADIRSLEARIKLKRGRLETQHRLMLEAEGESRSVFSFDQVYYSIGIFTTQISPTYARVRATNSLHSGLVALSALADSIQDEAKVPQDPFLNQAHRQLPYAISNAYLAHSDRLVNELAFSMGTRAFHTEPRIVATALLRNGGEYALRMRLMQPGLEAIPRQGVPVASATGLISLVSYLESDLESQLLAKIQSVPLQTASAVFQKAITEDSELLTIDRSNLRDVSKLKLGKTRSDSLRQEVTRFGRIVLIPKGAAKDGTPSRAWWSVSPTNGSVHGSTGEGLLTAASETAGKEALGESAIQLMKKVLVLSDSTEDLQAYVGLVCKSRDDVVRLMQSYCAKKGPVELPDHNTCLSAPPHVDNLVGSCDERLNGARCGVSIASALLSGKLTALYSDSESESSKTRHKGKAFGITCQ